MTNLIHKYNINAPRYTSYPTVPNWQSNPKEKEWLQSIKSEYSQDRGLDIYLHIPFCEKLCWYCGCHRTITKDKTKGSDYTHFLKKEWSIYLEKLNGLNIKINSIHIGGGTPTFLPPKDLDNLLAMFTPYLKEDFIGAIEIDPRTCKDEHLNVLQKNKFTRVSLGIQDFNREVQFAINRHQSFELVNELVSKIRQRGFESINFDLIYGLPKQTLETIESTIEDVMQLGPDLIAFYSYAHLPELLENQKLIKDIDLPKGENKRKLYELGKSLLHKNGFVEIGLDHFSKVDNYLYRSYQSGTLHRNFMGYTDKKSNILIGLGISSISSTGNCYIQNNKRATDYNNLLDDNKLPFEKGHLLSSEDIIHGKIINSFMCTGAIATSEIENLSDSECIFTNLQQFIDDEILIIKDGFYALTEKGHPFLRNIATVFDQYYSSKQQKTKYSTVV